MKNLFKNLIFALTVMLVLASSAFAAPIQVSDIKVQEVNGEYVALVSLDNLNTNSSPYTKLFFLIEDLGTAQDVGVVTIDTNETEILQYNLKEVFSNYNMLKKGSVYELTVSTEFSSSMTESFLYGPETDSEGLGLAFEDVIINGVEVRGDTLSVMNGENLEVKLVYTALESFDNARFNLFVEGYEHSSLVESTEIFSVVQGKTYTKTMSIELPNDMNTLRDYKLRITGANDLSGITYKEYDVYVDTQRNRVDVLDLVMTPSSGVEPGQNIIANVRMKNRGQKDQDSVKVYVEIADLLVSESSYVSNLNSDEVATSDDMLLFVPETATAGQYDVTVRLVYNDGYEETTDAYTINVLSAREVEEKNLLVSFKNNVDLEASVETSFEVVIANPNSESKPISISALDNAWAEVEVSPSLAMVKGGDSETFTVKVTPKSAISGEKELPLVIKEGSNTVSELKVSTYVAPAAEDSQINWVNVALAVLLIIAIIVLLALVITIAKRKGSDDEDNSSTEEYY